MIPSKILSTRRAGAHAHTLNHAALRQNLAVVRQQARGCRVMAVIKSNGYGHGMDEVSAAIATQVDAFAVATCTKVLHAVN